MGIRSRFNAGLDVFSNFVSNASKRPRTDGIHETVVVQSNTTAGSELESPSKKNIEDEMPPPRYLKPVPTEAPQEITMSAVSGFFADIEKGGVKIGTFLVNLATGVKNLQKIYSTLSGPTIAAIAAVFYDSVKTVSAATSAGAAAESGNFVVAVTLSETTVSLVKQVVEDAKAGEKVIVADLAALGIKL